MHIGLIGGIGPAATDVYYRGLISRAAEMGKPLDVTIVHADAPTLLGNLAKNQSGAQCAIYDRLTNRLKAAGAECVVVTSIAGHFCVDDFAPNSALPVIDLPTALSAWLQQQGLTKVGILGTAPVMASGMYGKLAPVEVLAPEGDGLDDVHTAYVTLATSGTPSPKLRSVFDTAGHALMARGAEAVLLGGTDLNAAFPNGQAEFPLVDCADIHIAEVARHI